MNAKKKRTKNKRRARKLADQAWDAANEGNLQLALKIIRRAIDLDIGNPMLWNDRGTLLRQHGDQDGAVESFLAVISLAPDFAEAYAHLAEIRLRQGRIDEAVILQTQAVRHAPLCERHREKLSAYTAVAGGDGGFVASTGDAAGAHDTLDEEVPESNLRLEYATLAARVDDLDWEELQAHVSQHGFVKIVDLLSYEQCRELRGMFEDEARFAKTVVMDKSRFGQGVYRYFAAPLPPLVDTVRRFVYPYAAAIANHWQQALGDSERFPGEWEGIRATCALAGQVTPSPLMLRYETGGFNALHRDIRGDVFFPLQLVVVLSPCRKPFDDDADEDGFEGGEFLFSDDPQRKPGACHQVAAGLGDAVLFCTRARPVRVAGVFGWQSVKHGAALVTAGTRYALGIPFHEFT